MLRVNCWYPRSRLIGEAGAEHEKYFSIGVCHNHNFDFYTTCILGPGYLSDFMSTDQVLENLEEGDSIDFQKQ